MNHEDCIEKVPSDITDKTIKLITELSSAFSEKPINKRILCDSIASGSLYLFVYRTGDIFAGMTSVCVFHTLFGIRAQIEDVFVLPAYQRQGIAQALVNRALTQAEELGALKVELTSRPSRTSANRLYKKMGFQLRETNVYAWAFRKKGYICP